MDLSVFEMTGVKSYTRFWGMMMFGTFSIINVVVLLNLLIAMMSNSYTLITVSVTFSSSGIIMPRMNDGWMIWWMIWWMKEHSDMEWKFARARLWMSYFELGHTLPSPFNLIVTPKQLIRFFDRGSKKLLSRLSTKVWNCTSSFLISKWKDQRNTNLIMGQYNYNILWTWIYHILWGYISLISAVDKQLLSRCVGDHLHIDRLVDS